MPPAPPRPAPLGELLKRCRPETAAAAAVYHETGDTALLPVVLTGVIERFVEPALRPRLAAADDTLRLAEDLGLDSLTLLEIVLLAEEVFAIDVSAAEIRHLRTLGQIKTCIAGKARGVPRSDAPRPG